MVEQMGYEFQTKAFMYVKCKLTVFSLADAFVFRMKNVDIFKVQEYGIIFLANPKRLVYWFPYRIYAGYFQTEIRHSLPFADSHCFPWARIDRNAIPMLIGQEDSLSQQYIMEYLYFIFYCTFFPSY